MPLSKESYVSAPSPWNVQLPVQRFPLVPVSLELVQIAYPASLSLEVSLLPMVMYTSSPSFTTTPLTVVTSIATDTFHPRRPPI